MHLLKCCYGNSMLCCYGNSTCMAFASQNLFFFFLSVVFILLFPTLSQFSHLLFPTHQPALKTQSQDSYQESVKASMCFFQET